LLITRPSVQPNNVEAMTQMAWVINNLNKSDNGKCFQAKAGAHFYLVFSVLRGSKARTLPIYLTGSVSL
jgi:hypothetical protein